MDFLTKIILVILGLSGLSIAAYIRHSKLFKEKLVCPIGFDCNSVVKSDYSRFLGIPVEILGIIYYSLVAIGYFISFFIEPSENFVLFLAFASILAFLFSIYLTIIQAFLLRQWCTWCLISAALSTTIFLLVIF